MTAASPRTASSSTAPMIRNEPASFQLNGVIPGWTDGLQKMQPGDVFMFWIPWKQAYGEERPRRMEIPPKADLMFKVELLKRHA